MPYANLNLEGRLVNDPEIKVGKNEKEFCTFRVAVNQQFGAYENASFYDCTGDERIANRIKKVGLTKGRLIHVTGGLMLKEYKTKDNQTRISADVSILEWHFVGGKPKSEESGKTGAPAKAGGKTNAEEYVGDPDELPL